MELHKRRKALTEPEVRYLMQQTLLAVDHLHRSNIIHRDIKLGNLFLNDEMWIKIGDFGLATKVEHDGERKRWVEFGVGLQCLVSLSTADTPPPHRTLCGTPNYIAPEVLNKKGHSFEVDIWSLGCVL